MIPVLETERKIIQKEHPHNKLKIASTRKRSGGSTYYALPSDRKTIEILARERKTSIKEIIGNYERVYY